MSVTSVKGNSDGLAVFTGLFQIKVWSGMLHKDPAVLTDRHTYGCTRLRTDMRVCMHGRTVSRSVHYCCYNPMKSHKVKTSAGLLEKTHENRNILFPSIFFLSCLPVCVWHMHTVMVCFNRCRIYLIRLLILSEYLHACFNWGGQIMCFCVYSCMGEVCV